MQTILKTIVVLPNWVGDAVIAQPLIALLQRQGQEVFVLAHGVIAELARLMPGVTVIDADFSRHGLRLASRWRFARRVIAPQRFDAAIVLPNSFKSALIPCFAGIKGRIGYRGEMRYGLINQMHFDRPGTLPTSATPAAKTNAVASPSPQGRAMAAFYAALAYPPAVGDRLVAAWQQGGDPELAAAMPKDLPHSIPFPALTPPPELLAVPTLPCQRYAVFAPGAEFGPAKRWGVENYAQLAGQLVSAGLVDGVVLLGNAKDRPEGEAIVVHAATLGTTALSNLCGDTSLSAAAGIIASSTVVVSNDSGLMHIATALGKPVLGLYGPTDPEHTPPRGESARFLSLRLDCSPCQQRRCPLLHQRCMKELSPTLVAATVGEMLADPPPRASWHSTTL